MKIYLPILSIFLFTQSESFSQALHPYRNCPNVNIAIVRAGTNADINNPYFLYNVNQATGAMTLVPGGPYLDPSNPSANLQVNGIGVNRVDGFIYGYVTVGGNDSTDIVLSMVQQLGRNDINCILLGGLIISLFNIINGKFINEMTELPVIGISYKKSMGLKDSIYGYYEDERIHDYMRLDERKPLTLWTGKTVFVRHWGINFSDASKLINSLVLQGSKPEPLRIAALAARAHRNFVER